MEENNNEQHQRLLTKLEASPPPHDSVDGASATFVLVFSIFVSVAGSFVAGCAMGFSSPVQSEIVADLGLTTADFSLFGSMLTLGGLLGSLVCGRIADYIGRRWTMCLADILYFIGWFAIAFSQGAWSLDLGRSALGFAIGLTIFVVPVYIAEVTPKNLRGGSVLLHQLMLSCGIALAYVVGLMVTWRSLAFVGTIPCLIQLLGLFFIPESPRWLAKIEHLEGYEAALRSLRGKNADISAEATEIKEYTEAVVHIKEDDLFSIFKMKYAYALTATLGLMALSSFGGTNGILFYATTIFESANFSGTVGTVAMAFFQLPPVVLGVFLMDKFGRRPLLLFSAFGMGTATLSLALSFLMEEHGWMKDFSPYLALVGLLIYSAAFPVGMGGIPFIIMSEIFPMNVKGAAGSLATIVNWSSGWIVSYTFNLMMDWSFSGTFFMFTSINVFSLIFVAKLVPETKGRTLEEVQESITHTLQ